MNHTARFFLRLTLHDAGRPPLSGDTPRTIIVAIVDGDITSRGQDEFFDGQIVVDHDGGHITILPETPVPASPVTDGASLLYVLQYMGRLYHLAQQRQTYLAEVEGDKKF